MSSTRFVWLFWGERKPQEHYECIFVLWLLQAAASNLTSESKHNNNWGFQNPINIIHIIIVLLLYLNKVKCKCFNALVIIMFYLFNNIIEEVKEASKNKLLLLLVSGLTLYTLWFYWSLPLLRLWLLQMIMF